VDRSVIEKKLDSLYRCLSRIKQKLPPTAEDLARDIDVQDIVVLNLSRAVQLSVDIATHWVCETNQQAPNTMGEAFDLLARQGLIEASMAANLKKAVGFRNVAVHNYDSLNWDMVFAIASKHMEDLQGYAKRIAQNINPKNFS
jgi:uncharacterized protein YutE (UPF0331/DUF86 family)